ncbi:GIY-YIG nuclease family protein [Halieaceae bacterium IMCC14734]|uniref:GIY-YIG nuclease family protein n=1 Tax=Candidatus Litorirhabdus singularis TaxID=2518993 RepID=A0ABT3TB43_9GAMM|nr:GIY-YIG nuclease family protein [Candidatus Litorirhabdus singularis]MCX2979513.1 GIY-YIG nuclease family protein [Candidatus Litorirhabdus singularis]
MTASADSAGGWWVYLLRCADGSFYTGVATDPLRRLRQHNGELVGGARYTRGRRPSVLVWQQPCSDRSAAQRREAEIKQLTRQQKLDMAAAGDDCSASIHVLGGISE